MSKMLTGLATAALTLMLAVAAHASPAITTTSPSGPGNHTMGTSVNVGGDLSGLSDPYYNYVYRIDLYINSDDYTHSYGPLVMDPATSSNSWSLTWDTTGEAAATYELDAYLLRTVMGTNNFQICAGSYIGGQTLVP